MLLSILIHSGYYLVALASRQVLTLRTFAVTNPRQLAPTVGLAHGGVEFLEGSFPGFQEVHEFSDEEEPVWKGLRLQSARSALKEKLGLLSNDPATRRIRGRINICYTGRLASRDKNQPRPY